MRILLLAGGWSSERNVSLSGANVVSEALRRLGHSVTLFDPAHSLEGFAHAAKTHDFTFIGLHGAPGEDGLIQAFLERAGCPYQGSGPAGSFLALDKAASKELFRLHGLRTPDWAFLHAMPAPDWEPGFAWPVFVKPNTGGSSLGLGRAHTIADLHELLENIFRSGATAIVEPAIPGCEVSCGMLGEASLPPILIRPAQGHDFFDYIAKYTKGAAIEICPAPISEAASAEIRHITETAHHALGLSGYSRADFILTDTDEPYLLEINTLPGMTATSLLPQEAAAIGYSFDQLVERLISLGLERHAAHNQG